MSHRRVASTFRLHVRKGCIAAEHPCINPLLWMNVFMYTSVCLHADGRGRRKGAKSARLAGHIIFGVLTQYDAGGSESEKQINKKTEWSISCAKLGDTLERHVDTKRGAAVTRTFIVYFVSCDAAGKFTAFKKALISAKRLGRVFGSALLYTVATVAVLTHERERAVDRHDLITPFATFIAQ